MDVLALVAGLLLVPASPRGNDLFVAPDGDDAHPGSAERPFASPQRALDVARPGDRVVVRRGIYPGRFVIAHGGATGAPLVFEGEPGAVLDGGDRIAGWEPVKGAGPGVFRNVNVKYAARLVTWRQRTLVDLGGGYTYTDEVAREIWRKPANDPYWDGVEGHYAVLDGVGQIRLRRGQDPDDEEIALAPLDSAVVRVAGASHVVIRGFEVRNAYWGVALSGASDCVVERCFVRAFGKAGVLLERGASRNHVRDNEITQDYVFPDFGHPWAAPLHHHVWTVWKDLGHGDRMAVRLEGDYGDENEIHGNHVFRCFDGIVAKKGGRRNRFYANVLEYIADDGLALDGTEIESEWHDNLVVEGGNCGIVVDGYAHTKGPIWIYRNRVHHVQSENPGDGIHFKNALPKEARVFVYHNSFSANGPSVSANDWTAAGSNLPGVDDASHVLFVNNVFSSKDFWRGWPRWPEIGIGRYSHNWVGGANAGDWRKEPFFLGSNVVARGDAMWTPPTEPSFLPAGDVRGVGLDLSRPFTLFGEKFDPLPGFETAAKRAPDLGAVPSGTAALEPPEKLAAARAGAAVQLTWLDRSRRETAFLVDRSLDGRVFTTIARVDADSSGFTDPAPPAEAWYVVRAADFGSAWVSARSNVARLRP